MRSSFHLGLQVEDIDDNVMAACNDGSSSYPTRESHKSLGKENISKGRQFRLLLAGARNDVLQGRRGLFSPYCVDRVLDYFDGIIALVSVFLFEELGWERTLNTREDPTPLLLSLLCFFHVMVYWINTHHWQKFSPDTFNLPQIWLFMLYCLGLVLYPLSLGTWIEKGESDIYFYINTAICFILMLFNQLTKIDGDANSLFRLWHRLGPASAFLVYGIATILNWRGIGGGQYIAYVAPFTFMVPLGAKNGEGQNHSNDATRPNYSIHNVMNICHGAYQDLKCGNVLSPYPADRVLDFFDAVIGLATVFIFIETGTDIIDDEQSDGRLAALLCYVHVMAFWINIHSMFRFSPSTMSVWQVWCVVCFSLGIVFYPLCIQAWIAEGSVDEGSVSLYYEINLALCSCGVLLVFLTKIERGRSNCLYRVWHKLAPISATIWYLIAYILLKTGREQLWMIIIAPFMFMAPLGAKKATLPAEKHSNHLLEHEDRFEDNSICNDGRHEKDMFFDCSEEPTGFNEGS